jgi:hypothetical protein
MQTRSLQLGRTPSIPDSRTLLLSRYLATTLPPPPATADWTPGVRRWPMYLNDRYGDCTCAAAGHMIEAWSATAHHARVPTDVAVLRFYEHFTTPAPENGCNMLDVLKYWRNTGVDRDRITAFALLQQRNVVQAKNSIALFGGMYIGLSLPDYVVEVDDLVAAPWEMSADGTAGRGAPSPYNGHCVNAVGYDAAHLYVVTWGAIKTMSWKFYQAYSDEAYAVLSPDFLAAGKSPAGFDVAQLQTDLGSIARAA